MTRRVDQDTVLLVSTVNWAYDRRCERSTGRGIAVYGVVVIGLLVFGRTWHRCLGVDQPGAIGTHVGNKKR